MELFDLHRELVIVVLVLKELGFDHFSEVSDLGEFSWKLFDLLCEVVDGVLNLTGL